MQYSVVLFLASVQVLYLVHVEACEYEGPLLQEMLFLMQLLNWSLACPMKKTWDEEVQIHGFAFVATALRLERP